MIPIVILAFLIQVVLSIKRPVYALCWLLLVKILIPDNVRFPFVDISLNTSCSIALFLGWIISRVAKPNSKNKLIKFLLFFFVYCTISIFLTFSNVPVSIQFKTYIMYVVIQLLPIIVMIFVVRTEEDVKLLIKIFSFAVFICSLYSIVCFFLQIPYPYNNWINAQYGSRDGNLDNMFNVSMAGIMGRCMGTATSGTYDYGMVISSLFICIGAIYYVLKKKCLLYLWILVGLNVLCTTRRSPILTAIVFIVILFVFENKANIRKKIKYIIYPFLLILLCVNIFPVLEDFKNIIESTLFFWNESIAEKNEVTGSSVSYRTYQLNRTISLIKENPFFGNGWGACYYKDKYPDMNGWESIVFTTLMQFGYIGALMWIFLFYNFYKYSCRSGFKVLSVAFMASGMTLCLFTDSIYPFYIFFGSVLINKFSLLSVKKSD